MTYLGIRAAAALLGISHYSLRRMLRRRLIEHVIYPVGGVRIAVADLEAFRARCRVAPTVALPTIKALRERHATKDQLAWRSKNLALAKLGRTS